MAIHVNDSGVWRDTDQPYVNDAGVWKPCTEVWVNDAGTWKLAWGKPGKANLSHVGFGLFQITNFVPTVTYQITVDQGSASVDATGRVVLSARNAVATITPRRGTQNGPTSTAERKEYTCYWETQSEYGHAAPCHGNNIGPCPNGCGPYCNPSFDGCYHSEICLRKDALPPGYSDGFSEWWRVA